MSLNIEYLTIKNFMSIGNVTQSVQFKNGELYLVLGENLDLGGNDNRNGVGKTTIVNALCYVLYGKPLSGNIKLNNLINKTNGKGMMCGVSFTKDGKRYKIERGRGPAVFKLYIDDKEVEDTDEDDNQARGESKNTQVQITKILGMQYEMFRNIVTMTTHTDPFLKMRPIEQREIIEELLGVTVLSEKASLLADMKRKTKELIRDEEVQINAVKKSNETFQSNIKSLQTRSVAWERSKQNNINNYASELEKLDNLDIDIELEGHKTHAEAREHASKVSTVTNELRHTESQIKRHDTAIKKAEKQLAGLDHSEECPTCNQTIGADIRDRLRDEANQTIEKHAAEITALSETYEKQAAELSKLNEKQFIKYELEYRSYEEALEHKSKITALADKLEDVISSENPYTDQIQQLQDEGIQEINYDTLNELTKRLDHEEYLFKLMNNKDSFIRKKVINQNLAFLNSRLKSYLDQLSLPHQVVFQADLSVDIQEHGRDLDFDNLSRGERTRLSLGLSWAFRDVFEHMNTSVNVMMIDELLDNGLDVNGVECALRTLKNHVRNSNKCVHLVSHRDELVGRVNNTIKVIKENGFTTIEDESTTDA